MKLPAPRQVPIWQQRAGRPNREGLVVWDYHVVLIQQQGPRTQEVLQPQQQQQMNSQQEQQLQQLHVQQQQLTQRQPVQSHPMQQTAGVVSLLTRTAVAAGSAAATTFTHSHTVSHREEMLSESLPGLADSTSSCVCGGGRGSSSNSGTQDPPICAHALVWDLDTTLPFPCSLQQYAGDALRGSSELTGARER